MPISSFFIINFFLNASFALSQPLPYIFKILLSIFLIIILLISYLSIFGIETDKFNNQILNKVKEIDKRIKVELKEIKLVLDPFNLKLNIKTIGTELEIQNKKIAKK